MAQLGKLTVDLEANIARFTDDMGKASKQTEQAMQRMKSAADMVKTAVGLIGVGISFDAVLGQVNKSINALADLDDMAQRTGSSIEGLSKLGKVAAMTGTDFGAVDSVLVKLSKSMTDVDGNGGKVRAALEAIGVSADGIEQRDPSKVFVEITRKLQDYRDGAGKVALVNDLMGKSAADLLPYMNDVAEKFDNFTGDSTEAAAAAAKFQDDMGALRVKFDEWTTSVVTAALPAATDFVGALGDLSRESNDVTKNNVSSWADDTALGLARVIDVGGVLVKTFSAVSGSFQVAAADIKALGSLAAAGLKMKAGGNATMDIAAAMMEREAVIKEANARYERLWSQPANAMEQAILKRIATRNVLNEVAKIDTASMDAMAGMLPAGGQGSGKVLNYGATEPKKAKEQFRSGMIKHSPVEATVRAGGLEDSSLIEAALAESSRIFQEQEYIRQSLLTQAQLEDEAHAARLDALYEFQDAKLSSVEEANALIEAETARHEQAKADLQMAAQQSVLYMAQDSAGQLYSLMKQAGMEQTALGKAVFLAQKAMAVAQIIMNTEVAAASALAPPPIGLGPVAGIPFSAMIRTMGYASAGLTAGLAIADASAEGGYDIPAGVNPMTQLHEKEMVLPKAQADVIRGLAQSGGAGGGAITIVNQTTGRIDRVVEQQVSPTERALIIQEAVSVVAAQMGDPNSKTSRAMSRNFNTPRTR